MSEDGVTEKDIQFNLKDLKIICEALRHKIEPVMGIESDYLGGVFPEHYTLGQIRNECEKTMIKTSTQIAVIERKKELKDE